MAWPVTPRRRGRGSEAAVVVMASLLLMLVPLQALGLTRTQQLEFWVLNTSVQWVQNGYPPVNREPLFLVNHSLTMLCQYATSDNGINYCDPRPETNLTVTPGERMGEERRGLIFSNMVEVERTKCNLTVEIHNVTTAFQGFYFCSDSLNPGVFRMRRFYVGEAPVSPQNLSIVFQPAANITFLFDPVKTGLDLNHLETRWDVQYKWKDDYQDCPEKSDSMCRHLTAEGLCQACVVTLERYTGCGQYSNGNIDRSFSLKWRVGNKFGNSMSQEPLAFNLFDWVKPEQVSIEVDDQATTTSSLVLRASASGVIDYGMFAKMDSSPFPLFLQHSLDLIDAREQSMLSSASQRFFNTYGFVRNLQDEEQAFSDGLRESNFSGVTELQRWTSEETSCSSKPTSQMVIIGDLPFAGYHYRVSMTTKARYWGTPVTLPLEGAKTKDAAPEEGPGLQVNFFHCLPTNSNMCATCLLYFKEIPATKRGGEVLRHTLSVNLTAFNESQGFLPSSFSGEGHGCENTEGLVLTTGGHNNTFIVPQLAMGGVYEVRIQAVNREGASPVTSGVMPVTASPPEFAPRDIVVEKSSTSYDLSWRPGKSADGAPITYFAHYCYTIYMQLSQVSMEALRPLNCVTNMVTVPVPENNSNSFIFDQVLAHRDLVPAFFLSAVGPGGEPSGLQAIGCFYDRGKYPRAVDAISAQPAEGDPTGALQVRFSLPCGPDLNYKEGRPHFSAIGVAPHASCQSHCGEVMQGQDVIKQPITGSLEGQVMNTWRHLQPQTRYCVGVNVAGWDGYLRKDSWSCMAASTSKEGEGNSSWRIPVGIIIAVIFAIVIIFIIYNVRSQCKLFEKKFGVIDFKPHPSLQAVVSVTSESEGLTKGMVNPVFTLDSPLLTMAEAVAIDMPADHSSDTQPQFTTSAKEEDSVSVGREPDSCPTTQQTSTDNHDKTSDSEDGETNGEEDSGTSQSVDDNDNNEVCEDADCVRARYHSQPSHDASAVEPGMACGRDSVASALHNSHPSLGPLAPALHKTVTRDGSLGQGEEEESEDFKKLSQEEEEEDEEDEEDEDDEEEEDDQEEDDQEEADWSRSRVADNRYARTRSESSSPSAAGPAADPMGIDIDQILSSANNALSASPQLSAPGLHMPTVFPPAEEAHPGSRLSALPSGSNPATRPTSGPVASHSPGQRESSPQSDPSPQSQWSSQSEDVGGGPSAGVVDGSAGKADTTAPTPPASGDVNIDAILQSFQRSTSPASFELSPAVKQFSGEEGASGSNAASVEHPGMEKVPRMPSAAGGEDSGVTRPHTATQQRGASWCLPTEHSADSQAAAKPRGLAVTGAGGSSSCRPPPALLAGDSGTMSLSLSPQQEPSWEEAGDNSNPYDLNNILKAAEKCLWKDDDEGRPGTGDEGGWKGGGAIPGTAGQRQRRALWDSDSLLRSSQESGFSTDQDRSSTEPPHDGFFQSPPSSPTDGADFGLARKALLSQSDSNGSGCEGSEEDRSPSEDRLLTFAQPKSTALAANSPKLISIRL